jgi:hypothetical protein
MHRTFTRKKIIKISEDQNSVINDVNVSVPSNEVIQNILNYSKALSIRKSRMIEKFEMILN